MKINVYEYSGYLLFLKAIYDENRKTRGYQRRMAEAAGCQPSFISQVMRGKTHLTPDQAAGLCEFWHFSESQSEYFLSLVNFERSGSKKYRRLLQLKLDRLRNEHREIGKRIKHRGRVSKSGEAEYYSDWTWALIHIMTSVDRFKSAEDIGSALAIKTEHVLSVLTSLEKMGLTKQNLGSWEIGLNQVHLDRSSIFNRMNHKNFRQLAINRLSVSNDPDDFHYSAVYGLDLKTRDVIREMLLNLVSEANERVLSSKEQAVACLTADFFTVG